jgi:dTDP-4-dehydrorhamnose reductase
MKILLTGAKGMLGRDLVPVLEGEGHEVTATDIEELDITDPDQIKEVVRATVPDMIINCAAYTQVDKAEKEPDKTFLINGTGTQNVALACREFGIDICYISTDYVFDGEKEELYVPDDKTDPINKYGASKLAGENAIRQIWDRFYIIRTSWLYGKNGKNFVHTILDLARNQNAIRVVDDQIGSPTWTVSLARALSKIIQTGEFGIYHVTDVTGKGISWYRFAQEILSLAHLENRVIPIKSAEFPQAADRPKYSVLDLKAVQTLLGEKLPDWKDSLRQFISLDYKG